MYLAALFNNAVNPRTVFDRGQGRISEDLAQNRPWSMITGIRQAETAGQMSADSDSNPGQDEHKTNSYIPSRKLVTRTDRSSGSAWRKRRSNRADKNTWPEFG